MTEQARAAAAMSANLVLASICFALVIILSMVVTAVVAYFLWNGAMWWLDATSKAVNSSGNNTTSVSSEIAIAPRTSWCGAPPAWHLPSDPSLLQPPDQLLRDFLKNTASPHRHSQHGLARPGSGISSSSGGATCSDRFDLRQMHTSPVCMAIDSPPRSSGSPRVVISDSPSVAAPSGNLLNSECFESSIPMQPASVHPADLRRGYSAQLALKFGGNLSFHADNVAALVEVYRLEPEDLCYCFLCLEEVANAETGPGLSLKKWGTGSFAARLWIVVLGRFVKSAQKQRCAQDESRVQELCEQWTYSHPHFLREMKSCEVTFQRNHGRVLLQAFQQNEIRQAEVVRARRILGEHGATSAPRSSRLALVESAAQPPSQQSSSLRALRPQLGDYDSEALNERNGASDRMALVAKKRALEAAPAAAAATKRGRQTRK